MSCAVRDTILPQSKGVRVNGVAIHRDLIAREIQNHPAKNPAAAWTAAARALVVRELLLQEARRLDVAATPVSDGDRHETQEEAAIRTLVEHEITTPRPDDAVCRRFYDNNKSRFRSADIYSAAHILVGADARDSESYERARAKAAALCADVKARPEAFADFARAHSDCPSAEQGGNLGQITADDATPEFAAALRGLAAGELTAEPVATRYGFHIIRLDRRIDGTLVPYEMVADKIATYLADRPGARGGPPPITPGGPPPAPPLMASLWLMPTLYGFTEETRHAAWRSDRQP
jgi:peptidyl-prolyl cis-trans isomerase C